MGGRRRGCVVSRIAGNGIGESGVCGLLPSLLPLPQLSFHIDVKPSSCIFSDAWRQAGLAVPPDEAVSQGWGAGWEAVLKHLQEVRICVFIAGVVRSPRPSYMSFKFACNSFFFLQSFSPSDKCCANPRETRAAPVCCAGFNLGLRRTVRPADDVVRFGTRVLFA
jgi:hypothetical protein